MSLKVKKVEVKICFQSESQMNFKRTNQVSFFKIDDNFTVFSGLSHEAT